MIGLLIAMGVPLCILGFMSACDLLDMIDEHRERKRVDARRQRLLLMQRIERDQQLRSQADQQLRNQAGDLLEWKNGSPPRDAKLDELGRWVRSPQAQQILRDPNMGDGIWYAVEATRDPAPPEESALERWDEAYWNAIEDGLDYPDAVKEADCRVPEGVIRENPQN